MPRRDAVAEVVGHRECRQQVQPEAREPEQRDAEPQRPAHERQAEQRRQQRSKQPEAVDAEQVVVHRQGVLAGSVNGRPRVPRLEGLGDHLLGRGVSVAEGHEVAALAGIAALRARAGLDVAQEVRAHGDQVVARLVLDRGGGEAFQRCAGARVERLEVPPGYRARVPDVLERALARVRRRALAERLRARRRGEPRAVGERRDARVEVPPAHVAEPEIAAALDLEGPDVEREDDGGSGDDGARREQPRAPVTAREQGAERDHGDRHEADVAREHGRGAEGAGGGQPAAVDPRARGRERPRPGQRPSWPA